MLRRLLVTGAAVVGLLVFTSTAGAAQLGVTSPPSGSATSVCGAGLLIGQYTDDPTTPYFIPAGGGAITQWQTYTAGDTAGSSLTLTVLHRTSSTTYTVTGASTETLPNPLPSNNIASFSLSTPLLVAAGDTLALYSSAGYACYFDGGTTPSGDTLFASTGTGVPTAGETVTSIATSGSSYTLNLAATFVPNQDVSVQTSSFPTTTDVAGAALLRSVVTNGGPGASPITFVDQVPSGLAIQSASTGSGTCAVSGQTVTCTITGLAAGQSTLVEVVVTTANAGSYANAVTVSDAAGVPDPNPANNTASGSVVFAPSPLKCVVPGLRKTPQSIASAVLVDLGCGVTVVHQHSGLKKGLVLGVREGVGTHPYQQTVTLIVSSGPKPKHKHKHKHK